MTMGRAARYVAAMVLVTIVAQDILLAVGSKNAAYYGGTITVFGTPEDPVEGRLDMLNERVLVFTPTDKDFLGKTFSIPYESIVDLEYGQKAGRRIGAAAATTVLFGPVGLLTLFSKKRKHFLTIGFKD